MNKTFPLRSSQQKGKKKKVMDGKRIVLEIQFLAQYSNSAPLATIFNFVADILLVYKKKYTKSLTLAKDFYKSFFTQLRYMVIVFELCQENMQYLNFLASLY